MKIKIIYNNLLSPYNDEIEKYTETIMEINDKTTLKDIFINSQQGNADVSKYYNLSSRYYYNSNVLPYIKKTDNTVIWEPSYNEIKVIDFIFTHNIQDNIIYADTGIPQAGGPDLKDFIQLWNEYYDVISQIVTLFGFVNGVLKIGKFFEKVFIDKFKNKKILPPQGVFDLILSKKQWNHNELSQNLDIDKEDAKNILKLLGYKWDNSRKLYIQQRDPKEIIDKLSKVKFWQYG
ncbi:hypothetical protein Z968_04195 [Clostridium novyi A str. 4552]|uniref:Uncharacterized protein n=1 Tax=Clostridium novyi A str. 4552 TaxID=1444289 RepID=A0A0A0ICE6_CLONO|nr:hypothetical protein [Clostridium novyi]KGM97210.1 hypothetical protein Z968_04195 [Clostridium novyi A str. 4552]